VRCDNRGLPHQTRPSRPLLLPSLILTLRTTATLLLRILMTTTALLTDKFGRAFYTLKGTAKITPRVPQLDISVRLAYILPREAEKLLALPLLSR
jgi:hypothetical protein